MASTSLLVLPLHSCSSLTSFTSLMHCLASKGPKDIRSRLLVHLFNTERSTNMKWLRKEGLNRARQILKASIVVPNVDVHVLSRVSKVASIEEHVVHVDHVYYDGCLDASAVRDQLQSWLRPPLPAMAPIATDEKLKEVRQESDEDCFEVYDHVVMGGTFDRLHVGHKVLLTEALFRCNQSLTIGVTQGPMTANKTLSQLILPISQRLQDLENYLRLCDPSLKFNLVPIDDPYGPSIVDERLQCIVGSKETENGCHKVNEKRVANGLNKLDVVIIDVEEDPHREEDIEETKISSRSMRLRMLGSRLKPPLKPHRADEPYVIGLTGGSASGKSSIALRLQALGAGVVDCDKLGHKAYERGTDCFEQVVLSFGRDILTDEGTIDRRRLGAKIFSSPDAKAKLESIVWPEIRRLASLQIDHLFQNEEKRVIVLDAAVLLAADWHLSLCNEVWVCFIDPKEAVKRIVERDGKTEEEAKARIASQLSNEEVLKHANIAFCTQWKESFTQKQVEKAWSLLTFLSD